MLIIQHIVKKFSTSFASGQIDVRESTVIRIGVFILRL
jgi:hypothetical protein